MMVTNQSECGTKMYIKGLQKLTEWSVIVTGD